ncbi:MAG TPA: hypothetical protein VMM12_05625 [Longimicrobiales bacterium]|nr:hypothetical protein [Longimicrobiales bacterium]
MGTSLRGISRRAYDEVSARRFDGRATPDLERLAAELIARYG